MPVNGMGRHLTGILLGATAILFEACTGLFGGLYDEPEETPKPVIITEEDTKSDTLLHTVSGLLYIDASSWKDWYYIDLQAIANPQTREQAVTQIGQPYPIPTTGDDKADRDYGIYTYWFDVWGKGINVYEFRQFKATSAQPSPDSWSLAVHRNNVRTNDGGVYETQLTNIDQLSMQKEELKALPFTTDEWTKNAVWADDSQMLNSLIGCQGISINPVLSSWLRLDIPPMPPAFTHNNHVFILRNNDGTFAALQLTNYISPSGIKCCLTIQYKYPL